MNFKITKGEILNISSNEDSYRRGLQYYKSGKIIDLTCLPDDSGCEVKSMIQGNYKKYNVTLLFDTKGNLTHYHCTCQAHGIWRGACKHVAAVLLEVSSESDTADKMLDRMARQLTNDFERRVIAEMEDCFADEDLAGHRINIIPTISINENKQVTMSFTLGSKKQYVIKNVNNFLKNVENGEFVSYGKNLQFVHKMSAFDQSSVRLIKFMLKENSVYHEVLDAAISSSYYRSIFSYNSISGRSMAISKRGWDDFFDMYEGETLKVSATGLFEKDRSLCSGPPPIKFETMVEGNSLRLKGVHCSFCLFSGMAYQYLVLEDAVYRMDKEAAQIISDMLRVFQVLKNPEIVFKDEDLNKFIMFIRPKLLELKLIDNMELPQELCPIKLKTRYYFDIEDNCLTCKLIFVYDEYELNPLLLKTDNEPLRDLPGEYKAIQRIRQCGFLPNDAKGLYILANEDLIYEFYHLGLSELNEETRGESEIYVSGAFEDKSVRQTKTSVGVRIKGNLLEMSIRTTNYSPAELLEAVNSYIKKKKYHRFKDGRFLSLETEDMQSTAEIISSLDLTKKEFKDGNIVIPRYRAMYLEGVMGQNHNIEFKRDKAFKQLTQDFKNYHDLEFTVPEDMEAVLREYQKTGFNWLKMLTHYGFGGILADDMGLGKTIQVIALLLSEKGNKASLVVTPTSVLYNWQREIEKFAGSLKVVVVAGLPAKRKELLESTDGVDILITTYDMLKRDIELYEKKEFRFVVADEAQNIKNPATQNAQVVKLLKSDANIALTGTPVENSLMELWSIFDFIMPGYLFNQHKFTTHYETPIVKNDDKDRAQRLRRQIEPFILRRIKTDVLKELPEKLETILYADMTQEQKKIYDAYLLKARGELDEVINQGQYSKSQIKILAELTRLRQICCHPSLFIEKYEGGSGKLELAIETIISIIESGHRILLFSGFTSMLTIILEELKAQGIDHFYLDGGTDARIRSEMAERFNKGEKNIFLISLKAGGTGLNLTGADVVIHFDQWWNPAIMDQASDRAHRYGQKKIVQVFNIVAKDSIEEKILALQEKKKNLIDSVIKEGTSFLNKMSEEEIKELFKE